MRFLLTIFTLMGLMITTGANAQEWYEPKDVGKPNMVKLGVGYSHLFDKDESDKITGLIEYNWGHEYALGLSPFAAFQADVDGAMWAGLGLDRDFRVTDKIIFTPSFAPGLYRDGGGYDLGGALEFRTGVELAYEFPTKGRAAVQLSHMSNANIYDENPGTNLLTLNYSFPLGQ